MSDAPDALSGGDVLGGPPQGSPPQPEPQSGAPTAPPSLDFQLRALTELVTVLERENETLLSQVEAERFVNSYLVGQRLQSRPNRLARPSLRLWVRLCLQRLFRPLQSIGRALRKR